MAKIQKVTDSARVVTDPEMLRELARQNIDKDYVEFFQDYGAVHAGLSPYAKFYRDLRSGRRFMVVSGLPKVTGGGAKVEAKWLPSGGKYFSETNLLSASVELRKVEVSVEGKKATWHPQVFLNGVEQSCSQAKLLETDPDNEHYQFNVLEWDYGICRRRLRLIHGAILEKYIFDADPQGDVVIKSNWRGQLQPSAYYAVDADGEPLPFEVVGDEKRVPASSLAGAVYPVIVDDSLTAYSTTSDGDIFINDSDYETQHDHSGSGATVRDTLNDAAWSNHYSGSDYNSGRVLFFFPTSSLGVGADIIAVTFSLYGEAGNEDDAGHLDFAVVEGIQHDPLQDTDYGGHLSKTTLGQDSYYDYSASFVTNDYNDITLNSTGRGWINKTGTTKLCMRCRGDIDKTTPTGANYAFVWCSEKGTGYQPKLVITYTPGVTPKTSSDSGGGAESSSQIAALSKSDTGSGAESLGSRILASAETGSGVGASSLLAMLIGTEEAGLGSEFATKAFSVFDSGTGVDAVITRLLAVTEAGSALEAALLVAVLVSDEGGLGSDLSTLLGAILAGDEGSGFGALRALVEIPAIGSDMRSPASLGQAGIPSKGVNL